MIAYKTVQHSFVRL